MTFYRSHFGNLLLIVVTILTAFLVYKVLDNRTMKTGYVDLNKVLSEFKLKQELEQKLTLITEKRNMIIDSLEFELKVLSKQLNQEKLPAKDKISLFETKKEEYFEKKKNFEDDNARLTKQYDEQIFTQLNQYVKDFGEKNEYAYILGADGSGVLMYSDQGMNITEEVNKYVNERYKGNSR
jgi:outer membrane protein